MVLAASLLIFYSLTLEQRRMIGDEAEQGVGRLTLSCGDHSWHMQSGSSLPDTDRT